MALVAAHEASSASSAIGGAPAPGQPATDEINQLDAAQSRPDGQSGDGSQKCDGKGKGKGKGKPSAVKASFVWSDEEVEMLLSCTNDYKSQKAAEGNDWESVRTKYGDIQTMFHQCVLDAQENGNAAFKHKPEEITKEVITSKLKNIRIKYREAVDNGRRSGHGRVAMLFFELSESIWEAPLPQKS